MDEEKDQDIRWEQRFSNFNRALTKLTEAVEYIASELMTDDTAIGDNSRERVLTEIVKEGLIQRFEYTYEMAWNVMKDYAGFQGDTSISGSRDAIRFAFSAGLIDHGELWMEMIKSRIKTTHTYNEESANEIFLKIMKDYYSLFIAFQKTMESKRSGEQQDPSG